MAIERSRMECPEFEPEFDRSYFSMEMVPDNRGDAFSLRESILISLCACGVACRYHGQEYKMGHRLIKEKKVAELKSKYNVIPICPEIMGGLPRLDAPAA